MNDAERRYYETLLREELGAATPPDVAARVRKALEDGETIGARRAAPSSPNAAPSVNRMARLRQRIGVIAAAACAVAGIALMSLAGRDTSNTNGGGAITSNAGGDNGPAHRHAAAGGEDALPFEGSPGDPTYVIKTLDDVERTPADARSLICREAAPEVFGALTRFYRLSALTVEGSVDQSRWLTNAAVAKVAQVSTLDELTINLEPQTHTSPVELFDLDMDYFGDRGMAAVGAMHGLTRLELVSVRSISLESARGIASLANLRELSMTDCPVANDWLGVLCGMTWLEKLMLTRRSPFAAFDSRGAYVNSRPMSFDDAGVAKLGNLFNLRMLGLSGHHMLSTDGLSALRGLSQLERLDLSDCPGIGDEALAIAGGFTELRALLLSRPANNRWDFFDPIEPETQPVVRRQITSAGIAALANLTKIEQLDLSGRPEITDEALTTISGLSSLDWLSLAHCPVTDEGMWHLAGLNRLERLDLSECLMVTGRGLNALRGCTRLRELSLTGSGALNNDAVETLNVHFLFDLGQPLFPALEMLDLSARPGAPSAIGDSGLRWLAVYKNLRVLRLNGVAEGASEAELHAMPGAPEWALGRAPSELPAYFHPTQFTGEGLRALLPHNGKSGLEQLRELHIAHNHNLTSADAMQLEQLPRLEAVNLLGDKNVSPGAAKALFVALGQRAVAQGRWAMVQAPDGEMLNSAQPGALEDAAREVERMLADGTLEQVSRTIKETNEPPAGTPQDTGDVTPREPRIISEAEALARLRQMSGIHASLQWLADHQSPEGFWSAEHYLDHTVRGKRGAKVTNNVEFCPGAGNDTGWDSVDAGLTGLALLAFAGDGHTHMEGSFREQVKRGLKWVLSKQDAEGCFGARFGDEYVYNHAMCTMALAEISTVSGDAQLKQPLRHAVDFIVAAQNPGLGWRYGVKPGENDSSVTAWMVLALKSAGIAGLTFDKEKVFGGANAWFDKVTLKNNQGRYETGYNAPNVGGSRLDAAGEYEATPAMDACCMTVRLLTHNKKPGDAVLADQTKNLLDRLPKWEQQWLDYYYWYYGTLALFQIGGDAWTRWEKALLPTLLEHQRGWHAKDIAAFGEGVSKVGDGTEAGRWKLDEHGSWDPVDAWGTAGGRVYATAINTLTLQVYYRYARTTAPAKAIARLPQGAENPVGR